jgi:hypothetical protein
MKVDVPHEYLWDRYPRPPFWLGTSSRDGACFHLREIATTGHDNVSQWDSGVAELICSYRFPESGPRRLGALFHAIEHMWLTLVFFGAAGLFTAWMFSALWHVCWVRRLPRAEPGAGSRADTRSTCSVVIAARDEEARIEETLRRLLAQRDVELEIIVVDDRSADRTGEIVHRIAAADARVRLLRVDVLPAGWLGKCYACHLGARSATSEWILFTDADCWLAPDVVSRALDVAEREAADHVTLIAGVASASICLKAAHLLFLLSLANWISGVNRDRSKAHLGIGAFNLVCAEAYRQCGGYEALRLTVIDDIRLGLLLRRAGKRTRAFLGGDDVECHWGSKAWDMVKILEKNYFAALDFRLAPALVGSTFAALLIMIPIAGLVSGSVAGFSAALSPLLLIAPASILARRLAWPWLSALAMPAMLPLFLYAVLNSAIVTLRRGGICWRETFYPLAELRAHGVR